MALPNPPSDLDLTESRVPEIIGALVSTWALAAIAVVLRIVARRLSGNTPWVEDWLVIVSLVAASIHVFSTVGYMIPHGVGKHIWVVPATVTKAWALGLFVAEIVYTLTLTTVKWSTLIFYWRIFSANPSIRIPIWSLFVIVAAWGTAVLGISIFQCSPPRSFWERFDPVNPMPPDQYRCTVDSNKFFNGNSIPNIITDGLIVMLPLPYIWNLRLRTSHKLAVGFIFALGAFVTTISIVRLLYMLNVDLSSPDITWNFCDAIIWSNVEANIAIVCCCLPSLRMLLGLHRTAKSTAQSGGINSGSYAGGSGAHAIVSKGGTAVDDQHPFSRLDEQDSSSCNEDAVVGHELVDLGQTRGIAVTKEFRLRSATSVDD